VKPAVAFNVTELPWQIVVEPAGVMVSACGVFTETTIAAEVDGQLLEPTAETEYEPATEALMLAPDWFPEGVVQTYDVKPAAAVSVAGVPEHIEAAPLGVVVRAIGLLTITLTTEDVEGQLLEPVAVTEYAPAAEAVMLAPVCVPEGVVQV
jgi:hypothetical protein